MNVFVVMKMIICDDYYYGYNENLDVIYGTFEEAKKYVDDFLLTNKRFNGLNRNPFIKIIRMELGNNTNKEIVFDSMEEEDDSSNNP